jgi:putative salt-induced outer membrane protein
MEAMVGSAPSTAFAAGLAGALALSAPALAAPLPEGMRAMIAKAAESHDPTVIAAVVNVAKQAAPDSAAEIEAAAAEAADALATKQAAEVIAMPPPPAPAPAAPVIELPKFAERPKPEWKGAVELGGARATGATDVLGAYGSVDLARVTPTWTQRLTAKADYQETNGQKSTERFSLAYQPQVRLRPELYAYSLGQYEHDRFLGYRNRYTVGVGAGLTLIDRPDFRVAFDAGPALRSTEFYALEREDALAGRGSLAIKWLPSRRITLSQEGAIYVEGAQTSAKSSTALETLLFGPLKGRLSYEVQHERDARVNRSAIDTSTRASLLYSF